MANSANIAETKARLTACWEVKLDWELYPQKLREVIKPYYFEMCLYNSGCMYWNAIVRQMLLDIYTSIVLL